MALVVAVLAAACSSGSRRAGDVLRVAVGRIDTFDPAMARTVDEQLADGLLYQTLTTYLPGSLEATSGLAIRWRYTTDERQWTFFLRPGAKFANGRPVTSTDVKYSLERVARKGSGSPAAGLLQPITGWQPFAVDGTAPELVGITTPTPDSVRIVLDQPWALFPSALANLALAIVPREAVEVTAPTPALGDRPDGSGPYRFDGRKGDRVLLRARGSGGPSRVELDEYPSASTAWDALAAGDVDVAPLPPERTSSSRRDKTLLVPSVTEEFLAVNLKAAPLGDLATRQAISAAIDRTALVEAVFGPSASPLTALVGSGLAAHQADACGTPCAFDLSRASAAVGTLKAGGHPVALTLDCPDEPTATALASLLAGQLRAAGFDIQTRSHPADGFEAFVASGQAQLFTMQWAASYPSADAVLAPLFASGSPSNRTGFASPAVDASLRTARGASDPAVRDQNLESAERQILAQLPVIPLAQLQFHEAVAARVHGLTLLPTGTFDATQIRLEG